MKDGFVRVAASSPELKVADPAFNAGRIIEETKKAFQEKVKVLVFPELSVTGYTCSDLFFQERLKKAALEALERIMRETSGLDMLLFVGFPYSHNGKLYNTAAALKDGKVLALIPKKNIPNYSEFYERRWFTPSPEINEKVRFLGQDTVFGRRVILEADNPETLCIGAEICEDLWVPDPPSRELAENGATLIVNLSASDELIGKEEYRLSLVSSTSARYVSAYIYADASFGESTTDMVFTGSDIIAENGAVLASSNFREGSLLYSEIDTSRLVSEREKMTTYPAPWGGFDRISFSFEEAETPLSRSFPRQPFVPADEREREERAEKILTLQALGLRKRLDATRSRKSVVGLSGGLDSTLALLVTVKAYKLLNRDPKDIIAVTMPCFGTTERTKSNAEKLALALGVDFRSINITESVLRHFEDIGQSVSDFSVTYENGQARERTQVLMDLANKEGGLVIGTGDLSELALGWATYNGDHMSMYAVNSSVPKTLVRFLVRHAALELGGEAAAVLYDILDTPVSPELLPAKDGRISQVTEDIVGPYELHDFFLYYLVRCSYNPMKIYRIAVKTFDGLYSKETIKKWLVIFVRRFFNQQFKRSCLPDGPKVGSVTLSPRSDWRMPSDASSEAWLSEAEAITL